MDDDHRYKPAPEAVWEAIRERVAQAVREGRPRAEVPRSQIDDLKDLVDSLNGNNKQRGADDVTRIAAGVTAWLMAQPAEVRSELLDWCLPVAGAGGGAVAAYRWFDRPAVATCEALGISTDFAPLLSVLAGAATGGLLGDVLRARLRRLGETQASTSSVVRGRPTLRGVAPSTLPSMRTCRWCLARGLDELAAQTPTGRGCHRCGGWPS